MKFFDELDIERVNQQLNFETSDCKVSGGCDLFTTKPAGSDKKLYKTIDKHLDNLVQENAAFQKFLKEHQLNLNSFTSTNNTNNGNTSGETSPRLIQNEFESSGNHLRNGYRVRKGSRSNSSASITSFWEQKRRMSASESHHAFVANNNFHQINNTDGSNSSVKNNNAVTSEGSRTDQKEGGNVSNEAPLLASGFMKQGSNKLNDQNLEKLIDESSSSPTFYSKDRRTSSSSDPNNKFNFSIDHANSPSAATDGNSLQNVNINMGPFGPLTEIHSRKIFSYLIGILNASYPDHDFTSLAPTDFSGCSLKSLISKLENALISLGKTPQEWIWETISQHMDLSDCAIYQYNPDKSFMNDEIPGHLWSLMWFLFNKKRKRVAYLYLSVARLNPTSSGLMMQEHEKRRMTIEHTNMNNFEGEYDLTYDENAIDDDDDEESDGMNDINDNPDGETNVIVDKDDDYIENGDMSM